MLPHLRRRVVYQDEVDAAALSPDGKHYATIQGRTLRIYESGSESPLKEIPCDCGGGGVALSNALAFAAVGIKEEYKILDLKGGGTRTIKLKEGFTYSNFTLSPGGGISRSVAKLRDE